MQYRHSHVSPTMDLMAKKIFALPQVTAKFIHEILDLPVESVEILEGDQIHAQEFLEDIPFTTSVDVRARLDNGTEVIIEIQVLKQTYFLNRFHYYLSHQLVENTQRNRKQGKTHYMYQDMEPVYGIAILEQTILEDEASPVNVYELRNVENNRPLLSHYKDGKRQNLLRLAFLELDKYNKSKETAVSSAQRQWLEFFGNLPFSKEPDQIIQEADTLLDSASWTKEERDMIDERTRIRENWEMSMETFIEDTLKKGLAQGREEGLEQGLEQGLERGLEQGLAEGEQKAQLNVARALLRDGMDFDLVQRYTQLDLSTLQSLASELAAN